MLQHISRVDTHIMGMLSLYAAVDAEHISWRETIQRTSLASMDTYIGREEVKLVFRNKASWVEEGDLLDIGDLSGMIYLNSAFNRKKS